MKIKIKFDKFYEAMMESMRAKDAGKEGFITIEGEPVVDNTYKFSIGDKVFVHPYVDTHSVGIRRRILGQRWGKIKDTNILSPKKEVEGTCYFVESSDNIGGWEKQEDLELIVTSLPERG